MKLKLFLKKKSPNLTRNPHRFNPHRYWRMLLWGTLFGFLAVFLYFTLFFIETAAILDAPVAPASSENLSVIKRIQRDLETIRSFGVVPNSDAGFENQQ